jgi:hypothetical protein
MVITKLSHLSPKEHILSSGCGSRIRFLDMESSCENIATCIPIARQRVAKHNPATHAHATIEGRLLLRNGDVNTLLNNRKQCFPWGPPRHYITRISSSGTCVEAGSNTSTVNLQVVGGDEKGNLKSETVKYGHESHGNLTRERLHWRGPAAYTKDRPVL